MSTKLRISLAMSNKKALVIIVDGVEEIEAVSPIDILRRAEVDVTVASVGDSATVTGRGDIRIVADCRLEALEDTDFDLLVIPGGPGHKALLEDESVISRLQIQHARGGLIGSICAGPLVLQKAGLLEGRHFTSFPGTAEKLPARDSDTLVVVDRNLITSQGAGTAVNFGLALVEELLGTETARKVADSICFPGYPFG